MLEDAARTILAHIVERAAAADAEQRDALARAG